MLDAGYWMLDTGCWILDTGSSMLDAGYWILDAGCSMLDTGCSILVKVTNRYVVESGRQRVEGEKVRWWEGERIHAGGQTNC